MSHDLEDSVAAYAINALPPDEVLIVDAAVQVDPELRGEYERHRTVAARLADGFPEVVPAMSPDVWDRIARSAHLSTAPPEASPEPVVAPLVPRWRRAGSLVLGVAAVLMVVVLAASLLVLRSNEPSASDLALATAGQPGAVTVSLQVPNTDETAFSAILGPDGAGFLTAESLPALSDDRTYQLWAIVDDRIISAGVLGADPDVSPFRVEGNLVGLAVTEEIVGGVAVSENDPVALWLAEA